MDVYKTHGAFSWSELMTSDPQAAGTFYGALFGWTVKDGGAQMGHYLVANVGETAVGGIMSPPPGAPAMPPRWGVYVTVTNCDETMAKARALGGQVVMEPMDVPGVGRMAVISDPQGATFSIMQYSPG